MKTKTVSGICWIDGALRLGEQLRLTLVRGWANLTIPFSWRYTPYAKPGLPAYWPTVQMALAFSATPKPGVLATVRNGLKRLWTWLTSIARRTT